MPQTNKEKKAAYDKEYYIENKEAISARVKLYQENNKEKRSAKAKEWRKKNKEAIKQYYENNKEQINTKSKEWYENNKEKVAAQQKEYKEKNKEKIAAYKKEYREVNKVLIADMHKIWRTKPKNKQSLKEYNRMARYGITPDSFKRMLKEQNNKCRICLVEFDELIPNQKINVDHCHTTNQVRGLLCSLCNRGLGHFKDNTERLTNAINYLQEKE
tara:strand:+ start:145 stop:789 length:645 start_codon:yes stop_codon:yes gene_type:complete